MKKILIIGFTKIKYMPYLSLYKEIINGQDVSLLYWDRDETEDIEIYENLTKYPFRRCQQDQIFKPFKILNFFRFKHYVINHLKKNSYDYIIVLSTLPGVLISNCLLNEYRKRYVFDYRDVTLEKYPFFRTRVQKLLFNSKLNISSSVGFQQFYKKSKFHIVHNYDNINGNDYQSKSSSDKIRIGFIGFIRQFRFNKKIISIFSNDETFELHYYGREQKVAKQLSQYVALNNINNVIFHGSYLPKEKPSIYSNIDIINNLYENDYATKYAMGNKFYDGIKFKLPQICNKGSLMGNLVESYNIGITIDLNLPNVKQYLIDYYNNFDKLLFNLNIEKIEKAIISENQSSMEKLSEALK